MKKLLIIGVLIIAALGVTLWHMGACRKIEVNTADAGPFTVVYLGHKGPYHRIRGTIKQVERMLNERGIPAVEGFGEYFDDPHTVKSEDLRSNGGIVITDTVSVPEPFKTKVIGRREYASVSFTGSPAIGPFMVYPKFSQWMKDKGAVPDGPALELYRKEKGNMTIRYLMPFTATASGPVK